MLHSRQQGFTLLEVLLAGFILFTVIASMTLVYRGALLSSGKAESSLEMSSAVTPIRKIITDGFHDGNFAELKQGKGTYGKVSYDWQASLMLTGQPPAIVQEERGFGEDITYYLWTITVQLQLGSRSRSFKFSEISW
jgi:hypothetical protein